MELRHEVGGKHNQLAKLQGIFRCNGAITKSGLSGSDCGIGGVGVGIHGLAHLANSVGEFGGELFVAIFFGHFA